MHFTQIPPDFTLDEHRVDLFLFSLNQPIERFMPILSADEKKRAAQYYYDKHRNAFINARGQLRHILGRYLNIAPNALQFETEQYGKLYVINHESLTFNLSHSGGFGFLGVGKKHPLGVDIEWMKKRSFLALAEHKFSLSEQIGLSQLHSRAQPLGFYHVWVQKEALIKACGLGLHYPLDKFNTQVASPYQGLIFDSLNEKNWQMKTFMPMTMLWAAVCCVPSVLTINQCPAFRNLDNLTTNKT